MQAFIRSILPGALRLLALPADAAFDHQHRAWTTLRARHVQWSPAGTTTVGFARDRKVLDDCAAELGAVPMSGYARLSWPRVLDVELAARA